VINSGERGERGHKKTVRQAATIADKILRGVPAGSIPVVSAENYLQIEYNATVGMGLNLSEGLLASFYMIIPKYF